MAKIMQRDLDRNALVDVRSYLDREGFSYKRSRSAYAAVLCPFHDDTRPSLLIYLDTGRFQCQACGERGRDLIAFHQMRTGADFKRAFTELGGRFVSRGRR